MKGGDAKKIFFLGSLKGKPYLCNVFFIVLDLRLTRLGYSGIPFFLFIPQARFLKFLRKSLDFLQKHSRNTSEIYGKNRRFLPVKARLYDLMEENLKNSAVNLANRTRKCKFVAFKLT